MYFLVVYMYTCTFTSITSKTANKDFKIFTGLTEWTDRQTDKQNRLLNPFAHVRIG